MECLRVEADQWMREWEIPHTQTPLFMEDDIFTTKIKCPRIEELTKIH